MRTRLLALTSLLLPVWGQNAPRIQPAALDHTGTRAVFSSAINPEGRYAFALDLYGIQTYGLGLSRLKAFPEGDSLYGAHAVSITPDAALVAYAAGEEVRLLSTATGEDRLLAVNKPTCAHIAIFCPRCLFTCLGTPHISPDGKRVIYAAVDDRPFWVVNTDGTGLQNLMVFKGALGPSPQRVISRAGSFVFTSSAPFGPTFAPQAGDVYITDLEGGEIRQLTRSGNNSGIYARNASISEDGGIVVFESNRGTGRPEDSQIWIVRADGTGLAPLTSGPEPATQPSLSADGLLVVFIRAGQVWALPTSRGTEPLRLTNIQDPPARDPVVSGDGSRVVFSTDAGLYTVNTIASGVRTLYAPKTEPGEPSPFEPMRRSFRSGNWR